MLKNKLKSKLMTILAGVIYFSFAQFAMAEIGVLQSSTSSKAYSYKYNIDYSDKWNKFINNLNYANVKYEILNENDLTNITSKTNEILVLPLLFDLPECSYQNLVSYVKSGGKLILFFSESQTSPQVQKIQELIGVKTNSSKKLSNRTFIYQLNSDNIADNDFPANTEISNIIPNQTSKIIAVWGSVDENGAAITTSPSGSYIGWKWGLDGNLNFNTNIIKNVFDANVPRITIKEQSPIEYKVFVQNISDINKFRQKAQDNLEYLQLTNSPSVAEIQEHLILSKLQENLSKSLFTNNLYDKCTEELKNSKDNALYAYAKSSPSSMIEGRTLWIDRATIVGIKNQKQMGDLFEKIKNIGINLVYVETVNAGYSIYPSKIIEQNPQTVGHDPLDWAVKEAHSRNIQIHAWTWIFAAGNERHNPLIGKNPEYLGPILSKNSSLVLLGKNMSPAIPNQHEYWLDPSNPKSRQLIISFLEEIVKNYQLDGVQLDYIRYPFQTSNSYMGYNPEAKRKFEVETGYKLDKLDDPTLKAWNIWKTKQVSKFVEESSTRLKAIRPDLQISAAVFGGDRKKRISTIQQDWETWVANGWVDILNPMIYAPTPEKLAENIDYFIKAVGNKAFIYPGIAIKQLDCGNILNQLFIAKNQGLIGSTLFAMADLGPQKSELLSLGPYKLKEAKLPNKAPLLYSKLLIEEFILRAQDIANISKSDYWQRNIIDDANSIHSDIVKAEINPAASSLKKIIKSLEDLESTLLLSIDSDKKDDAIRTKALYEYINQSITLLSYQLHKQNLKEVSQNYVKVTAASPVLIKNQEVISSKVH